jgi:hypothetical protein
VLQKSRPLPRGASPFVQKAAAFPIQSAFGSLVLIEKRSDSFFWKPTLSDQMTPFDPMLF